MSKSSSIQELLGSDLTHGMAMMRRYYKASSLPIVERHKNRPQPCQFRRDRIMRRLSRIQMNYSLRKLQEQ